MALLQEPDPTFKVPDFAVEFQPVIIAEALTDEIEALNAIYGNETLEIAYAHNDKTRGRLSLPGHDIAIWIDFPPSYPQESPKINELDGSLRLRFAQKSRKLRAVLHICLHNVFVAGDVCMFDLLESSLPLIECLEDAGLDAERVAASDCNFVADDWKWTKRRHMPDLALGEVAECIICLEEAFTCQLVRAPCGHHFCFSCFEEGWYVAIQDNEPYTCCLERIPVELVKDAIDAQQEHVRKYNKMLAEKDTPHPFFCGNYGCGELIGAIDETRLKTKRLRTQGVRCQHCNRWSCATCRAPTHRGVCIADKDLVALFADQDIRRCPKCSHGIEKNGGCSHIHCRACDSHWWWREDGSMAPLRL